MTSITMTREEWEAKYQPGERIDNLQDTRLIGADPLTIWTELDCDGDTVIANGYHYVNREAYFICTIPFIEGEFIEIADEFADDEAELDAQADKDNPPT